MNIISPPQAQAYLKQGKIIAYPTEAVYGLGCDPFNREAVEKLLTLKQRSSSKGLIILISTWQQLPELIQPISTELLAPVQASWPGPVTWIFPKSQAIPAWISGESTGVAIRMSAHPIAQLLCSDMPIVSTSANVSSIAPARSIEDLLLQFPQGIDAIVEGELGGAMQPSAIYEVESGKRLR